MEQYGDASSNSRNKRIVRSQDSGVVIGEASDHANILNDAPNEENPHHHQYVPLANLTRIMRSALPPHTKIADDAKETVQECVSEFIHFITSEANVRCHKEHRKTIASEDLLSSMGALGFGHYVEPLTMFLNKHRMQDAGPLVGRPVRFVQPFARATSLAHPSQSSSASPPVVQVPSHVVQNSAMRDAQGNYIGHTQIGDQPSHDGHHGGSRRGSDRDGGASSCRRIGGS